MVAHSAAVVQNHQNFYYARCSTVFWGIQSEVARKRSGPWEADILAGKTNEERRKHISKETTSMAKHGRKERQ